jgi:hypothetical protein
MAADMHSRETTMATATKAVKKAAKGRKLIDPQAGVVVYWYDARLTIHDARTGLQFTFNCEPLVRDLTVQETASARKQSEERESGCTGYGPDPRGAEVAVNHLTPMRKTRSAFYRAVRVHEPGVYRANLWRQRGGRQPNITLQRRRQEDTRTSW